MCRKTSHSIFFTMPFSFALLMAVSSYAETLAPVPAKRSSTMTTKLRPSPNASPTPAKAASSGKSKKSTTEELTKKALNRAQIHELEREQQIEVGTTNEEVGPIIIKPLVKSEPAPGLAQPLQKEFTPAPLPATPAVASATSSATSNATSSANASVNTSAEADAESNSESQQTKSDGASQTKSVGASDVRVEPATTETRGANLESNSEKALATVVAPLSAMPSTPAKVQSATVFQASGPVSAEQSLKWLSNGNTRFSKKHFRADGRSEKDRARIWSEGQKPHAIVLACSDSVVPPEVVFDQALGEIYVIRTLGEVTDSASLASLEYAVQFLGSHLLVVMGHTRCDAVQGIVQVKEGEGAGSEALDLLLSQIRVHTKSYTSEKASRDLEVESTLNADGVARDLVNRSEIIRRRVEAGQLVIKSALYRGDSGKVSFY